MSQENISTDLPKENDSPHAKLGINPWSVLVAIVVVSVISFVSAQAPARIKLLGVYPIALGWLMGAIIKATDSDSGRITSRGKRLFIAFLAFLGLGLSTWIAFQNEEARTAATSSSNDLMAKGLIEQMKQATDISPGSETPPKSQSEKSIVAFRRYLTRRISQLGKWSSPIPEAFWLLELIAGGVAAVIGLEFRGLNSQRSVINEKSSL